MIVLQSRKVEALSDDPDTQNPDAKYYGYGYGFAYGYVWHISSFFYLLPVFE
jgi:hypothetical protein